MVDVAAALELVDVAAALELVDVAAALELVDVAGPSPRPSPTRAQIAGATTTL